MKPILSALIDSFAKIIKSKTFALLFLAFIVAGVALFIRKLTGEMWKDLVEWLIGGGTVRGTVEHVETKIKSVKNEVQASVARESDADLARDAARVAGTK